MTSGGEYDHEANPSARTEHLVAMSKNALIGEVLTLEERLAVAQRHLPPGATHFGRRLVDDDHEHEPVWDVALPGLTTDKTKTPTVALFTPAGAEIRKAFERREDIKTSHIATIVRPENTRWIVERLAVKFNGKGCEQCDAAGGLRDRCPVCAGRGGIKALADMTIVEIGAGIGWLAVDLARVARRVFAIEADPLFSQAFGRKLYEEKSSNLTWIFGTATPEMATWIPKADLVVIVTGSDDERLRKLGEHFAKMYGDVVMPWQDYNGGVAMIDYTRQPWEKSGSSPSENAKAREQDAEDDVHVDGSLGGLDDGTG